MVTGMPALGEVHGNAAAHGAGTQNACRGDFARLNVFADAGNLACRPLGKEDMTHGAGFVGIDADFENFTLARHTLVKGQINGSFDTFDAGIRRTHAPCLAFDLFAHGFEHTTVIKVDLDIPGAPMCAALGAFFGCKGNGAFQKIAFDNLVDNSDFGCLGGLQRTALKRSDQAQSRPRQSRGRRWVPPAPGGKPRLTSGWPTCALGTITR